MRAKRKNSRAIDPKQTVSIPMDVTFPHLEKIFACVPNNRKKLLKRLSSIKYFFINQRSKQCTFPDDIGIMLYIGQSCESLYEDDKESKQETVRNGSILLKANSSVKVSYVSLVETKRPQSLVFSGEQKGLWVYLC